MSLKEKTLFNTIDKVQTAIARIKEFEPPEGYYVAFSGGKDSIVMLDLVKDSGVKYDVHFSLTSVDPPELLKFVRKYYPDVQLDKPEITMWRLIPKKKIPPTRLVRYCCGILKERGGAGRKVMTGIRWAESSKRRKRQMVEACFKDTRKIYVNPIIDWTDDDVWEYIKSYKKMPYCELYDQGWKRIGCIGCPMNHNSQKQKLEQYPQFKKAYIRAFDKMVEARIASNLKTDWKTGQEVYDWWIANREQKDKDVNGQLVMFE